MVSFLFLSLVVITSTQFTHTARILCVYTVPFKSHQSVLQKFTELLAGEDHELVVLTPIPHQKRFKNVKEIVHSNSVELFAEYYQKYLKEYKSITLDPLTFMETVVRKISYKIFEAQINHPQMQEIITNDTEKFDLIIVESAVPVTLTVGARFQAPIIMVRTFLGYTREYHNMGAAVDPIFLPDVNLRPTSESTFFNKILSLYLNARLRWLDWQAEATEDVLIKKTFGDTGVPRTVELRKRIQMIFIFAHHVWDDNRPVPPSVLYLGPLHLLKPKEVSGDLKTFLDRSTQGVIYVSFGSKFELADLPPEKLSMILKVFGSLSYNVLLKWNKGSTPEKSKNIRFERWLPQNDLLHHPNIKLFVTHGGLQSTDEAISARVPLVGLPIFADQDDNTYKYEQHRIGIKLDIETLTEHNFKRAIIDGAENERYRKNIDRLAQIMEVERSGSLQKALKWVNFISDKGPINLKPPTTKLSFTEYYMLDLIITSVIVITFAILLVVTLIRNLFRLFISRINPKTKYE